MIVLYKIPNARLMVFLMYICSYIRSGTFIPRIYTNNPIINSLSRKRIYSICLLPFGFTQTILQIFRPVRVNSNALHETVILRLKSEVEILMDVYTPTGNLDGDDGKVSDGEGGGDMNVNDNGNMNDRENVNDKGNVNDEGKVSDGDNDGNDKSRNVNRWANMRRIYRLVKAYRPVMNVNGLVPRIIIMIIHGALKKCMAYWRKKGRKERKGPVRKERKGPVRKERKGPVRKGVRNFKVTKGMKPKDMNPKDMSESLRIAHNLIPSNFSSSNFSSADSSSAGSTSAGSSSHSPIPQHSQHTPLPQHSPLPIHPPRSNVILVHGMGGSSNSTYIKGMANVFLEKNTRVFCFNSRGTRHKPVKSIFSHIGLTSDLKEVVEYVISKYTGNIILIGFSLGSNWVVKLLGEYSHPRITMGIAICCPFDFISLNSYFNVPSPYRRLLYHLMTWKYKKYINRSMDHNIDLSTCTKVEEIDGKMLEYMMGRDIMRRGCESKEGEVIRRDSENREGEMIRGDYESGTKRDCENRDGEVMRRGCESGEGVRSNNKNKNENKNKNKNEPSLSRSDITSSSASCNGNKDNIHMDNRNSIHNGNKNEPGNFADLNDYYTSGSCKHYLMGVDKPLLILNSADDPLIPQSILPIEECMRNKNVGLVLIRGGHLGFFRNQKRTSAEIIVEEFYDKVVSEGDCA